LQGLCNWVSSFGVPRPLRSVHRILEATAITYNTVLGTSAQCACRVWASRKFPEMTICCHCQLLAVIAVTTSASAGHAMSYSSMPRQPHGSSAKCMYTSDCTQWDRVVLSTS
jgi:hypothetical protein